MNNLPKEVTFLQALFPILILLILIVYGLILRPQFFDDPALPLEIIFILAAIFSISQLFWLGFGWKEIEKSIVAKLARALPAFFILFSIGLIISGWMVCGTIPMLVYYGLKIINPSFLYVLAFLIAVVFSSLTVTSWGSAGTIGVVIIGIAGSLNAHMGITAGAIIGGAYFGDKMSPLSDTTNLAAIATEVDLFEHIHSMTYTTLPSAVIATVLFTALGFIYPPGVANGDLSSILPFLESLETMFNFNVFLLLPPLIVLYGSLRKKATVPTLITSVLTAAVLALIFQRFTVTDVVQSLYKGFHTGLVSWMDNVPLQVETLVTRGGLYALNDPIVIAIMVFVFIGSVDRINAIPVVVNRMLYFARSRRSTILSALAATAVTNALTSNQTATSFIIGDAFKSRFDMMKIPRKVLSRSLEDTGTMLESVIPWTTTTVFMVATLGVPFNDYWHWQLLSLINFIVAPMLAIFGIGCFYEKADEKNETLKEQNET